MIVQGKHYRTVWLDKQGVVKMIDQTLLPHRFEIIDLQEYRQTARAISVMQVRGAGAIGAAGAYGMAQCALTAPENRFQETMEQGAKVIGGTRPTAQNLFYGIGRVMNAALAEKNISARRAAAVAAAQAVADEDASSCERIGELGAGLLKDGYRVNTHCNAGWLAFVDWGSALSPIYKAKRQGLDIFVWVDETRPRSQGAKLTAWELEEEGIEHRVIIDGATGHMMKSGRIDMVIVGSDRIAANGDVANKIGTYSSAVLAAENNIPFYVAAPTSTIDFDCPTGDHIPIEERGEDEVRVIVGLCENGEERGVRITPPGTRAANPSFDVTPNRLVAGIITEKGIFKPTELHRINSDSSSREDGS
jgi:S-methyl-5-thioribose-1-phosphate isomerase